MDPESQTKTFGVHSDVSTLFIMEGNLSYQYFLCLVATHADVDSRSRVFYLNALEVEEEFGRIVFSVDTIHSRVGVAERHFHGLEVGRDAVATGENLP